MKIERLFLNRKIPTLLPFVFKEMRLNTTCQKRNFLNIRFHPRNVSKHPRCRSVNRVVYPTGSLFDSLGLAFYHILDGKTIGMSLYNSFPILTVPRLIEFKIHEHILKISFSLISFENYKMRMKYL